MPMTQPSRPATGGWLVALTVVLLFAACPLLNAQQTAVLSSAVQEQAKSDQASAQSQLRIGQLADQTTELLADYRLTLQQLDRIRIYNDNLATLVADQEAEKASIATQLEDFVVVEQGIVPLMFDMIESLTQFINLDMPFQLQERTRRAARLRDNMEKADITISERYRQIMDAYLIETDFGRSTEAYTGNLPLEGVDTQVDFLRVGRVLLAYQTQDRARTGFWNKQSGEWEALPDSYRNAVTQGLRIARKQAAPDLLRLPVPAAEPVQ